MLEMIIVLVIIGVLATLGLNQYTFFKEHNLGKEAIANLKLIMAAEKIYKIENEFYVSCADATTCNNVLKLAINSQNWAYVTTISTVPYGQQFTATAARGSCTWTLPYTGDDPVPSSTADCR